MMSSRYLRISRQHFDRVIKCLAKLIQNQASLSNRFRLTQRRNNVRVLANTHVQISLECVLWLTHEEESNLFWNCISNISQYKAKVLVNSHSEISHDCAASLRRSLGWRVAWRHTGWRLLLGLVWGGNIFEIIIVGEVVVEFRINNSFDKSASIVSQFLKNLYDDIHNYGSERREAHEDFIDDLGAEGFELRIAIVKAVNSRLTKFFKLGL